MTVVVQDITQNGYDDILFGNPYGLNVDVVWDEDNQQWIFT